MQSTCQRSKLRNLIAKIYYICRKYCHWYFSGKSFAASIDQKILPYEIFHHKTFLLRKLKNIEMWMQYNKIENLKIALKKINGLVIEPGQSFSYWRQIGNPTACKGYLEGMILNQGKVKPGVGGGLCQLSNLIYWMTLHTPLTVIERWRHSYDVFPDVQRTQPFGTGATCFYPSLDLEVKNNTQRKFQLYLEITDQYLVGKWFSDQPLEVRYEIVEKDHKVQSEWWKGYTRNNKIFRKIFEKGSGVELREEFITANQAIMMYSPFLEDKNLQS